MKMLEFVGGKWEEGRFGHWPEIRLRQVLYCGAIKWAQKAAFLYFDFLSIPKETKVSLINNSGATTTSRLHLFMYRTLGLAKSQFVRRQPDA